MTFRTKLTLVSIGLVVLTYVISSLVVGIVLWSKSENDAAREIETASRLIDQELQSRQEQYAAQAMQIVREENLPQTVWFLTTYRPDAEHLVSYPTSIQQLARMTLARGKLAAFDRLLICDARGNALLLAENETLGYYFPKQDGTVQFYQARLSEHERLEWEPAEFPANSLFLELADALHPEQTPSLSSITPATSYVQFDEQLALQAVIPIMYAGITDTETSVGFLVVTTFLDDAYAYRLSLLSRMEVNFFVQGQFFVGTLPEYTQLSISVPKRDVALSSSPMNAPISLADAKIKGTSYYTGIRALNDAHDTTIGSWALFFSKKQARSHLYYTMSSLILVGILVAAVITFVISLYTGRKFADPLVHLAELMRRIAEGGGDLTRRLGVSDGISSSEEITELTRWFNLFLEKLREIVIEVMSSTDYVTTSSQQLQTNAEELSGEVTAQSASILRIAEMMKSISQSAKENRALADEQAAFVNETSTYTSEIVQSIQKNTVTAEAQLQGARNVRDFVTNMSDTSQQVSQHALTTASLAAETASAVTQMSHAAHEIANTTRTQVDSTKKATDLVTNMAHISSETRIKVYETVELAEEALAAASNGQQAVNQTVAGMKAIAESSEQISDIIELIGDIAEQTDLLALNATIEAARAGKHGLGFGVVADEVRKLAERVGRSSQEITRLIRDSDKRVKQGSVLVHEANAALETIFKNVSSTVEQIKEVTTASEEQEKQSETVVQTITNVENLAILIEQATSQQVTAVEEILKTMEKLAKLADDITAQTDTQVKDGEQIKNIMTELAELSARIHTATLDQVSGTTQAFTLVQNIAEKAQQIVEKTSHQHKRSRQVFEEIQNLETISTRNAQTLQEVQQGAQELVNSVEKLRNLVRRFKV